MASVSSGKIDGLDSQTQGVSRGPLGNLAKHSRTVWVVLGTLLAVGAGVALLSSRKQEKSSQAQNAFYQAQQTAEKELAAMAKPVEPPKPAAPGAKAPPPAAPPENLEFKKLDVDAQMPKGVEAYKK